MPLQSICMLAQVWRGPIGDPRLWYVSTKYDGQRALWTGEGRLLSRYGKLIYAPDYFLESLPAGQALDGELWLGRGRFQELRSIVSRHEPDERWKEVKYIPFDMPRWSGFRFMGHEPFYKIVQYLPGQTLLESWDQVGELLDQELECGGEGLMLRHCHSRWIQKRTWDLQKIKPEFKGQGRLVSVNPGVGRLAGMMGSLTLEWSGGPGGRVTFDISGFTDSERRADWKLGSSVDFKYVSLTDKGVPREARYCRKP